jgi:hypothetical protein
MKFTLRTQELELRTPGEPTEIGDFYREVEIARPTLTMSHSPKQRLYVEIGNALRQAIIATTVPKEYWLVDLDADLQRMFNLPPTIPFG